MTRGLKLATALVALFYASIAHAAGFFYGGVYAGPPGVAGPALRSQCTIQLSSGTDGTCTFTPTAGDMIAVSGECSNGKGYLSCGDEGGANYWYGAGSAFGGNAGGCQPSGNNFWGNVFYALNVAGASTTVLCGCADGTPPSDFNVQDWGNMGYASADSYTCNGNTTSFSSLTTNSFTANNATDVLIGALGVNNPSGNIGSLAFVGTATPGSWTALTIPGNTNVTQLPFYDILSASGTAKANGAVAGSSGNSWNGFIYAFKANGGSAPPSYSHNSNSFTYQAEGGSGNQSYPKFLNHPSLTNGWLVVCGANDVSSTTNSFVLTDGTNQFFRYASKAQGSTNPVNLDGWYAQGLNATTAGAVNYIPDKNLIAASPVAADCAYFSNTSGHQVFTGNFVTCSGTGSSISCGPLTRTAIA
jgi:hypothetical protein